MPTWGTPVHRVLFCQDILIEILGHLSPGWFLGKFYDFRSNCPQVQRDLEARKICNRSLVAFALTCRAFSDLALAERWRVLDHHVLFLKLLPWITSDDDLSDEVIDLEPDIDEQAWSRFRWYARLIREMKIPVGTDIKISVHRNTWTVLASRLQGEPLLPTLRRIQVPAKVDDIVPFLFSLSPTVRTFTLEFDFTQEFHRTLRNRDFVHPFLSLISDPPGHPLDFSACQLLGLEAVSEEVMHHLRKCTRLSMLEDLDLTEIHPQIHHTSIAALSRLPSLRTLSTSLSVPDPSPTATPRFSFAGFAHLHVLKLRPLPLPTLSRILAAAGLRACPLRSLTLECTVPLTDNQLKLSPSDIPHHLAAIRAALPAALESLHVTVMCRARAEPPLPLSALFAPFCSLRQLQRFDVAFRWGYVPHVADGDLLALSGAWPRLEALSIWVWEMRAPEFSGARPPTVAGLVALAGGCPRLRRVTLPALDVWVLPDISTLPPEGFAGVRFLDVSALVHDEWVTVEDVARVLDTLFPSLEEYSHVGVGSPQAKSWHKVQDTLREIQVARRSVRWQ